MKKTIAPSVKREEKTRCTVKGEKKMWYVGGVLTQGFTSSLRWGKRGIKVMSPTTSVKKGGGFTWKKLYPRGKSRWEKGNVVPIRRARSGGQGAPGVGGDHVYFGKDEKGYYDRGGKRHIVPQEDSPGPPVKPLP